MAGPLTFLFGSTGSPGDDCLNLNIWTPTLGAANLPVLLWIHGGGFQIGAGSDPLYHGISFARDGVVFVSINYRLGAQGFLLTERDNGPANFAILDQLFALRWIQDNIAGFGGNPDSVTVAGESAGAMAVATLLATPAAKGLFHRAVVQSAAAHTGMSADSARAVTRILSDRAGCEATLDALRAIPIARLLAAEQVVANRTLAREDAPSIELMTAAVPMAFQPIYGTDELPYRPIDAIRDGCAPGIDILVGTTDDEMGGMLRVSGETFGIDGASGEMPFSVLAGLHQLIFPTGSPTIDEVVRTYRSRRPTASTLDIFAAFLADWMIGIPVARLADAQSRYATVYRYLLAWVGDGFDGRWGCSHGLDLPLVFDTGDTEQGRQLAGDRVPDQLVDAVHSAWVEFAKHGHPQRTGQSSWPAHVPEVPRVMRFDIESSVVHDPALQEHALWRDVL
jgi:para-nitrobenzyl esterase